VGVVLCIASLADVAEIGIAVPLARAGPIGIFVAHRERAPAPREGGDEDERRKGDEGRRIRWGRL
jgi:hypothetical protein